jgi:hypothetical protein
VYATGQDISKSYLKVGSQQQHLHKNLHSENPDKQFSHPVLFKQAMRQCIFYSGKLNGKISLHAYQLGDVKKIEEKVRQHKAKYRTHDDCSKPTSVPPSVWRAGLSPDPLPDPVITDVKHLIVHHSVSSNDAADQVAILRGIYLYHRVTLGWNDISYNYLIAPDRTNYEGRDPQGK